MRGRSRRRATLGRTPLASAIALAGAALALAGCGTERTLEPVPDPEPAAFEWNLPPGFPAPRVPEDDPMTAEKVALGRHLFYDQRLSGNQTQSCASCHVQALAFTDGLEVSVGSTDMVLPRSSMTLANVGYQPVLTWMHPTLTSLTEQMLIPLLATDPVELGISGMEQEVLDRLKADATYQSLFSDAFPDEADPFTIDNVTRAVASFQRTLISGNSPADRFREGDESALSLSEKNGHDLFFSDEPGKPGCVKCHSSGQNGVFFTSNFDFEGKPGPPHIQFDNNGLYNLDADGSYPEPNTGLFSHTGKPEDMGRFKIPTLRNVALTAPYMHDGSIRTLDEVLDHYAAGGRTITSGPYAGSVGSDNPHKSQLIEEFALSDQQREDLLAYLNALTDQEFISDPRFSDPWPAGSPAHGQP